MIQLYSQLLSNIIDFIHSIISSIEIKTKNNKQFVLFNNSETGILMFSCQSNLSSYFIKISVFYVDRIVEYCTYKFVFVSFSKLKNYTMFLYSTCMFLFKRKHRPNISNHLRQLNAKLLK